MSFNNTRTPSKPTEKARWQIPMRPHPTAGVMRYVLEGDTRDRFVRLFPIHSNQRIMRWFGISFSSLQRFKSELGLRKDMKAIRREHARDIRKICEKNGYYDSIRGKRPSEACLEAARRKRAEGFHPLLQLKADNPRRYRRLLEKRSEARKELLRREKMRQRFGLPQKTRLHAPLVPMTHAAIAQKHAMIKRLDYFSVREHPSWVCYDSETRRSPRSEATAVRHGLHIVEGEE